MEEFNYAPPPKIVTKGIWIVEFSDWIMSRRESTDLQILKLQRNIDGLLPMALSALGRRGHEDLVEHYGELCLQLISLKRDFDLLNPFYFNAKKGFHDPCLELGTPEIQLLWNMFEKESPNIVKPRES